MENSLAKNSLRSPVKLFLAGVFLAALASVPFFGYGTEFTFPSGSFNGSAPNAVISSGTDEPSPGSATAVAATNSGEATAQPAAAATKSGIPVRIKIPSLGINTNILQVGLTATGDMDTPKSSTAVAWYKLGTKPGEAGNAVIAGHVNTRYDSEGVFYNLDDIPLGAIVEIVDTAGKTFRFRVIQKKLLGHDDSTAEVFGPTSAKHLNLVTCTGTWLPDKKMFDQRLVVFTELVQ